MFFYNLITLFKNLIYSCDGKDECSVGNRYKDYFMNIKFEI